MSKQHVWVAFDGRNRFVGVYTSEDAARADDSVKAKYYAKCVLQSAGVSAHDPDPEGNSARDRHSEDEVSEVRPASLRVEVLPDQTNQVATPDAARLRQIRDEIASRINRLRIEGALHVKSWQPDHPDGPDVECAACDDIFGLAAFLSDILSGWDAQASELRALRAQLESSKWFPVTDPITGVTVWAECNNSIDGRHHPKNGRCIDCDQIVASPAQQEPQG